MSTKRPLKRLFISSAVIALGLLASRPCLSAPQATMGLEAVKSAVRRELTQEANLRRKAIASIRAMPSSGNFNEALRKATADVNAYLAANDDTTSRSTGVYKELKALRRGLADKEKALSDSLDRASPSLKGSYQRSLDKIHASQNQLEAAYSQLLKHRMGMQQGVSEFLRQLPEVHKLLSDLDPKALKEELEKAIEMEIKGRGLESGDDSAIEALRSESAALPPLPGQASNRMAGAASVDGGRSPDSEKARRARIERKAWLTGK